MSVVIFDSAAFKLRYPEFASRSDALTQMYFDEATLYLNNTDTSQVQDIGQRAMLLNMLAAHIAKLNPTDGSSGGGLAGPITSASEGSVSVGTSLPALPGTAAWYAMSTYGFAYWQATARYRTFKYRTPRQPFAQYPGLYGFGRRAW
jgi:hypothetical protein